MEIRFWDTSNFYRAIGLPCSLKDLGMGDISLSDLEKATEIACVPESDLHHLPFEVTPLQLATAMISTLESSASQNVTKSSQPQSPIGKS